MKRRSRIGAHRPALAPAEIGHSYPRFCVVGAGNGGLAMAGHLALSGFSVHLFNRTAEKLLSIEDRRGIRLEGEIEGFARLDVVTSNPVEALAGVDVVMVVVPASGHRSLAKAIAPYLADGQVVVLNPGRTLGALEFEYALRMGGCEADVVVAEAQTLLYASRIAGPGRVRVFKIKETVSIAALPAWRTERVVHLLNRAFPHFVPANHVLETSIDNMGALLHPAPTLFNMARIEAGEDFEYYCQGITPRVVQVISQLDHERISLAKGFGIEVQTLQKWLQTAYGIEVEDLTQALAGNPGYQGIKAPTTMPTRYLTEDVPMGLVPMAALGAMLGVPMPVTNSLITLASVADGVDYRLIGRNLDRVGLSHYTPQDLLYLVLEGRGDQYRRLLTV